MTNLNQPTCPTDPSERQPAVISRFGGEPLYRLDPGDELDHVIIDGDKVHAWIDGRYVSLRRNQITLK